LFVGDVMGFSVTAGGVVSIVKVTLLLVPRLPGSISWVASAE
jgi:hypothetical protein